MVTPCMHHACGHGAPRAGWPRGPRPNSAHGAARSVHPRRTHAAAGTGSRASRHCRRGSSAHTRPRRRCWHRQPGRSKAVASTTMQAASSSTRGGCGRPVARPPPPWECRATQSRQACREHAVGPQLGHCRGWARWPCQPCLSCTPHPHSARGSITRKMVRKRAVRRVYTSGMGDLVGVGVRVRVRLGLKSVGLDSVGLNLGSGKG